MGLLREQAGQIARKERTSVDVVSDAVAGAEKLQPALNAFTEIYTDAALEEARACDATSLDDRRPLHGVPVAVKDLFDVAGRVSSGCSRAFLASPPAAADSPHVAALRRAGAIVLGKTNQHELAFGGTNSVSCYGPANNPWDAERMTGGSSGGSGAAVGARIVGAALATDTGGSIRMPASFCGATGLKTTWARLPLHGMMPMSPTLDTAGAIATDAIDLALIFGALTGSSVGYGTGDPSEWPRIGLAHDPWLDATDPEVAAAVDAAATSLRERGADVRSVAIPWIEKAHEAWLPIALAEFAREYRFLLGREDELDPSLAVILHAGLGITADSERTALEHQVETRAAFEETMTDVDVLVLPATPHTAPLHEDQMVDCAGTDLPVHIGGPARFAEPINVVRAPAIVLPAGFSSTGLPIGMQMIGRRGAEELLIALGVAYQDETDWHARLPPHRA